MSVQLIKNEIYADNNGYDNTDDRTSVPEHISTGASDQSTPDTVDLKESLKVETLEKTVRKLQIIIGCSCIVFTVLHLIQTGLITGFTVSFSKEKQGTGSVYIRFGREKCPKKGTQLVYSGYVGGSYFGHTGAAVNFLCLPKDPTWGYFDEKIGTGATVYGSRYKFDVEQRNKSTKYFGSFLRNQGAVCAVCLSSRTNIVMIPGRNKCYPGWTIEYSGYLAAGHALHKAATEYVCVDSGAESQGNSSTGSGGAKPSVLFYLVEARCGSLPCPPYIERREITCVVCTK